MLSMGGQSFEDKFSAVKYFISGQGVSFVILKATTSELLGPKKKHLNYLVTITHEPNVSIPSLVKHLIQRASQNLEWNVVFKALITIHYLITYGDEKFIQNLTSSTCNHKSFDHLSSFNDRSSTQAYDMSTFVRRYSRYIALKLQAYKSLGIDYCRIKCLKETKEMPAPLKVKSMQFDRLVYTLPIIQSLFDSLMAFDANAKDLNNGIINSAFSMLYKDFVKLYIVYQTAIIRLLELYFSNKLLKQAERMLELYKKFLVRMDKVSDFMRVIDSVGMDKTDMPNVSRSPNLSLKLLEKYLKDLANSSTKMKNQNQSSSDLQNSSSVIIDCLPKIDYGTFGRRRSLRRTLSNNQDNNNTSSPGWKRLYPTIEANPFGEEAELAMKDDNNNENCSHEQFAKVCDNNKGEKQKEEAEAEEVDLLILEFEDKPKEKEEAIETVTQVQNSNNNDENEDDDDDKQSLMLMGDSQDIEEESEVAKLKKTIASLTTTSNSNKILETSNNRQPNSNSNNTTDWVQVEL